MIIHAFDLDMVPGGAKVERWLNQYDDDFSLRIHVISRNGNFNIQSGTTAEIRGTKPDGNGYSANATVDVTNAVVTVVGDQQITAAVGAGIFEIVLKCNGKELNSSNFLLHIERAALDKDTPSSESKIRELVNVMDNSAEIVAAGEQAADSVQAIAALAERAETAAGNAGDILNDVHERQNAIIVYVEQKETSLAQTIEDANETIDEKAQTVAALNTDAGVKAARALDAANNAENEVAELNNAVSDLRRKDSAMQLVLEGKVDSAYVDNGYLYLTSNGEIVAGPLGPFSGSGGGSGGGTSGNTASLSVTNNTGWLSRTIAEDGTAPVNIVWSSEEDGMPTGDGTAKITVNGAIKAMLNIQQGMVTIDLAAYCSSGANVIKVTISDVYDNSRTINFSVTVVTVSLSSSFDASTPYTGAISFPYIPVGEVQKLVHFLLDGREIGTASTAVSGRQMNYTIPQQAHGAHTLECYFDCVINGESVESNHLYYEIICLEALNNTPIIVSSFNKSTAIQYSTLNIGYTVYDPSSLTAVATISVGGEVAASQMVDRTEQVFAYRADEAGTLEMVITSGAATKTISVTVTESDIHVEAEEQNLVLHLDSIGRSNNEAHPEVWEDGSNHIAATLTGFNFASDGWQLDGSGVTVLRVSGDARVAIPYQIFAEDFRTTGKTVEVEFATHDVRDYDAALMSSLSGGRGLYITAQKATLTSEQSEISMQYKENEHVRLAFVVEKRSENRLLYVYVNGIMSGAVQYPASDDFAQTVPVGISIGSNDCTIDLYNIRIYDNDLTRHQILENWIADTQDVDELIKRYNRNNIYDAYGNVVVARLPGELPYMIIECDELPQYKGDKRTVSVNYVDPVTPTRSFTATGVQADVQGTSSQYYARKNYKLKFKGGFLLSGGSLVNAYALRPGAIATDAFCMKADVASSEGANNVELARLYNDTCVYQTPPQAQNSAVRQGIDGFPCVIFWSNGENTIFLGKYNFNNDKGTEEVFGFIAGDESWEIKNNTSDRVLWKSDDYSGDGWLNDFEARYPDTDPAYVNSDRLAALAAWLKSTDQSAATGNNLAEAVTYGSGDDAVTYTRDTADYRLAKFRNEAAQHMEMDSAIFYYLFTELFLMIDSRAKNAFPSQLSGDKWCWLPYDFDTALGINNEGALVFSYNLEDVDHIGVDDVYNGQQSVLWINMRQAFYEEIKTMYQTLRSTGALSFEKVETMFETHQEKWGEAIFNEDAYFKYLQPLIDDGSGAYLAMLQGSKAEQRKWWLYNRFRYIDSKYNAGDAQSDVIQLRGYAKADITVTPYADVYASVKYGSYLVQTRAARNNPYTLVCPLDNVNDTEIYIYSASQLASVGDLSGLRVGYADFSMGTKLQSIKLGDSAASYSNGNLKELYLGNNTLLQTLDVRNCPNLGKGDMKSVDISGCKNIENVYMDGTSVTGVDLPNGGILKVLHLPATITNLTVRNQPSIMDLTIPSYAGITTLWLENVSAAVNARTILNAIPDASRVRLIGIAWEASTCAEIITILDKLDTMRGLDEYGGNMAKAQVSGTIHIAVLSGAEMATIQERLENYPYLAVQADHTSAVLSYYNYDGSSLLHTETVLDGGDGTWSGTSTRASTAQYNYAFAGWNTLQDTYSADVNARKNVAGDRSVYAAFTRTTRTYTIIWKNSNGITLETDANVPYGTTPTYNGSTPQNPTSGGGSFQGWLPTVSTVTGDATYTASYVVTYTVYFYNGNTLLQTVTGVAAGSSATYTGATPVKDGVENPEDYTFTGWSPSPTNIRANTSCYAQFRAPSGAPTATTADGAYGVEWDCNNSSTVLTRKGLGASFSDPAPATALDGSDASPFDTIAPWKDMKRYNVINGEISYSQDDAGFSETEYDTVVYIPEFYYTAYKDTANSKWLWAISPTPLTGYVKHPGSGRYIGRFHTSGSSSGVFTKGGVAPLVNTSRTNFRTYSHNKGAKWWMIDLATWSALQMLYLVEFADWHSQSTLGTGYAGVTSAVAEMGATGSAAYHTLKISGGHNMYRWVEDPFSNCLDWVDGFTASSYAMYTSTDNNTYSDSTSGMTATGVSLPTSGGYINGLGYSEEAAWAFLPTASSGSETSYIPDRVVTNSGVRALCVGGYYSTGAHCGFFYFYAVSESSFASAYVGSRLLYIP